MNDPFSAVAPQSDAPMLDAAPLAPSLNLSAEQLQKFGLSDLPQGSKVTATVTFKVGGAGGGMGDTSLEALSFSDVTPVDGNPEEPSPGETEGTSADTAEDVAEGGNPLGEEDDASKEEEQMLGYKRSPKKKNAFPVDLKALQSRM